MFAINDVLRCSVAGSIGAWRSGACTDARKMHWLPTSWIVALTRRGAHTHSGLLHLLLAPLKALLFQRELQYNEPLVRTQLIGTHNSAISQAYRFGIEQDYIEGLLGKPL
jgi:hypothetical protein